MNSSLWSLGRQRNPETNTTQYMVWFIFILGLSSIGLNAFVTVVIFVNRHRVLKDVFYMLVLHCAAVDVIRGLSLSAWCLPGLNIFPKNTVLILTQAKKWIVILLQSLNLLTILNLLVFTANEYIIVKRPLQSRRIRRKRIVFAFVVLSWILSCSFALVNAWAKSHSSNIRAVYITNSKFRFNSSNEQSSEESNTGSDNQHFMSSKEGVTRSINMKDKPIVLYYNISINNVRRFPRGLQNIDELHYPFLFAIIIICLICLITVFSCYAMILKRIRNFKNCTKLKVGDQNYSKSCGSVLNGTIKAGATMRSKRMDCLVRNKYVLVIGSVLVVDILFLIPYSTIQLLQYINLTESNETSRWSAKPRLILQLIIGIHSVLQPLCYFRMKDVRHLAMCKKSSTNKEFNSKSRPTLYNRPSVDAIEEKIPSEKFRYSETKFIFKNRQIKSCQH